MEYIDRELERKFLEMDRFFKAVLVIGARQVGKSTMLKQLAKQQHRTIVTMDDDFLRELAQNDPRLFFQTYKPPILIDEIQKAPELLETIKILCDESDLRGQFWLTRLSAQKKSWKKSQGIPGRPSWHPASVWACPNGKKQAFWTLLPWISPWRVAKPKSAAAGQ